MLIHRAQKVNLELDLLREQRDSIDDEVQRFEWALKQVRVVLCWLGVPGWAQLQWGGGSSAIDEVRGDRGKHWSARAWVQIPRCSYIAVPSIGLIAKSY